MTAPRRWLRLDATWEESGWLDALSGEASGCWPRLLCLVKRDGVTGRCKAPNVDVLARKWRVSEMSVTALRDAAVKDGALLIEGGDWVVSNWDVYQEPDRTRKERQQRFRDRNAVTPRYGGVTRRVTETLTLDKPQTSTPAVRGKGWKIVPAEWEPSQKHRDLASELRVSLDAQLTAFREWEFKDPKSNADLAFFRWLRKAGSDAQNGNGNGRHHAQPKLSRLPLPEPT